MDAREESISMLAARHEDTEISADTLLLTSWGDSEGHVSIPAPEMSILEPITYPMVEMEDSNVTSPTAHASELKEVVIKEAKSPVSGQPEVNRADAMTGSLLDITLPLLEYDLTNNSGKAALLVIIPVLQDLLKQERLLSQCCSPNLDMTFHGLIEILDVIESKTTGLGTANHANLRIPMKQRMMKEQLKRLTSKERNQLYSVLFVIKSYLCEAALAKWSYEDDIDLLAEVEDVIMALSVVMDSMRVDIESILTFQRTIGNFIWTMNNVYNVKKYQDEKELTNILHKLTLDLMELANSHVSSLTERWVLFRPNAPFNLPTETQMSRQTSQMDDRHSMTSSAASREGKGMKELECEAFIQDYVQGLKGLKVIRFALMEMLKEERKNSAENSADLPSPFGSRRTIQYIQDGALITMQIKDLLTGPEAQEFKCVLEEAFAMTGELLQDGGRNLDPRKHRRNIYILPSGLKVKEMFLTSFLDKDKYKDMTMDDCIAGINCLVRLNNVLIHLMLSFERLKSLYDHLLGMDWLEDYGFDPSGSSPSISTTYFMPKGRRRLRVAADGDELSADGGGIIKLMGMFGRKTDGADMLLDIKWGPRTRQLLEKLSKLSEVAESLTKIRLEPWEQKDREAFEAKLKLSFGKRFNLVKVVKDININHLLFESEKIALKALVDSGEESVLDNLDKVTFSLVDNWEGSGGKVQRTLRGFPRPPQRGKADPLQESITLVKKTNIPRDKLKTENFKLLTLTIYPLLYIIDIITDGLVAAGHFNKGDLLYFGLTVIFILGPMTAEVISKVALKLFGPDKSLSWRNVWKLESLLLLPRSLKSLKFSWKSRLEFSEDLKTFYLALNSRRERNEQPLASAPVTMARKMSKAGFKERLIQSHFYAMSISNEKTLFNWKMAECLNESAPQLMLQLIITIFQFIGGESVESRSVIGILSSLASLSWTMHLCHFYMHYDGLANNFKMADRILDVLAHFFLISARFSAISFVAALHPKYFLIISAVYLTCRCIYLVYFSSIKWAYRMILKNWTMFLWPIHRIFITPYILRLWRCDAGDDLVYHLETFILALSWPYFVHKDHPMGHLRWTVPAAIMTTNFILLPLLLKLNESRHEPSRFCKEDDPFWLGKYMGKR
ncbi:uncharacterized protein [Hetaerina americana]|uniref:uncharacterized protein n=1 Tax=Hetaerina americana TaxID=62018 RepID=UPI003A7F620F